jgi:hypothetical protein
MLDGGAGDDRLIGGPDNDWRINGGLGIDTVVLSGVRQNYEIVLLGNKEYRIEDKRASSPDGMDLAEVEFFEFTGSVIIADAVDAIVNSDRVITWTVHSLDGVDTRVTWTNNGDGTSTTDIINTKQANGNSLTYYISRINGDGSRTVKWYDQDNTKPWSTLEQTFNANGILVTEKINHDQQPGSDLAYTWNYFDPGGNNWTKHTHTYDVNMAWLSEYWLYDDGAEYKFRNDPNSRDPSFKTQYQYFDSDSKLIEKDIMYYDDGSSYHKVWDRDNALSYSYDEIRYDTLSRMTFRQTDWKSAGAGVPGPYSYVDIWNYAAGATWTHYNQAKDLYGNPYWERYDLNGTVLNTKHWDRANAYAWSTLTNHFRADGTVHTSYQEMDNGNTISSAHNASSSITWQRETYVGGSFIDRAWDLYPWTAQPWDYLETHYNHLGQAHYQMAWWDDGLDKYWWWHTSTTPRDYRERLDHKDSEETVFRRIIYHDNSRIDQKWDPYNWYGHSWSKYYWKWDTAGKLISQYYVKDDGTVVRVVGPVAIDLDGNGIDLTPTRDSNVQFDWDGDGATESTGWVGSGDGLLVIDVGGDGIIDQRKEIAFTNWMPYATSDMEALAAVFDTNKDGIFNASDDRWGEFRIWQDKDQDGRSGADELQTLDSIGITSISLTLSGQEQSFADGSMINGTSTVIWSDGRQTNAADASLAYEPGILEDYYGADAKIQMSSTDSETLEATSKRDAFLFERYFGHDTVTGFQAQGNRDVIIFSKTVFADFASVMSAAKQRETDVLIEVNNENSLVLKNVMLASLQADDFRFSA